MGGETFQELCVTENIRKNQEKVYKKVVRPAMLYSLETVALRKKQEAKMEVAELKILRFSLKVTKINRIQNKPIRRPA